MLRRLRDKLDSTSYLPVTCALVFPLLAWVLGYYMGAWWWALTVVVIGAAAFWAFAHVIFEKGRIKYQVTLSKLDEHAPQHETIKKHATFIHTREVRRLMQTKGGMSYRQWRRFHKRLRQEQWANHFPKAHRGDTYMFVITYHREV